MTLSYKWLSEYLPKKVDPEQLSQLLTSIGLEVESMSPYEEVKGGLKGLIIGEVLETSKHPNADKLTLTKVNIGATSPLSIVCGAPNVAAGQKVVVAPVGATIYPTKGEPLTMRIAKIRGEESQGMICAEDEIGWGDSHAGIMVLNASAVPGTLAADYFNLYDDIIYEIGLTPNRMDAMSHWGVARDVCAYLSHHENKKWGPVKPTAAPLYSSNNELPFSVTIENTKACPRYSGVSIKGVTIGPSPAWMQQRLKAIGLRPINNIVDITNYIQHETGQPLHAFNADTIPGGKVIVKNLPAGTSFVTLDNIERKLDAEDLMICNEEGGLCIAGVFGGINSGVTQNTQNIFLESAFFEGITLRKTSFRHGLRTDAATRFEKGTDISATITVLERAVQLILEIAGGKVSSHLIDVYPQPAPKKEVTIEWSFFKKLSGKDYSPAACKGILQSLGFEVLEETAECLRIAVPYHKPDIEFPADLVEEIIRIDGLDNIEIPSTISITPAIESGDLRETLKEKISNQLAGMGFHEMMTNSITNASFYSEAEQVEMVTMLNSLSAELNAMRPSLLETSLQVVAHNLNHRNLTLRLFEFGKVYKKIDSGRYEEKERCCILVTGQRQETGWREKELPADLYTLKGVVESVCKGTGLSPVCVTAQEDPKLSGLIQWQLGKKRLGIAGEINGTLSSKFGIKQPVFFAELDWELMAQLAQEAKIKIREIPRFPAVQRDLALVVPNTLTWQTLEETVQKIRIQTLRDIKLFDIFESEKLGAGKKSMAVNFTFLDEEKTLTDKEIEGWMNKIMDTLEKELAITIRK
jgi:phenylalanyl-tRNA synthetase beta chain